MRRRWVRGLGPLRERALRRSHMRLGMGYDGGGSGGGGGGPISAITSITVMGVTPLDQTGDYGDATVRTGVLVNGWVAKAVMPFLVASTFDPTKITFNVTDAAFDAVGTATAARTIKGGAILRRQWNAAALRQDSNDGVTETVFFSLEDDIYASTTINSVAAAAGYYGIAASGSVATVVNSSTVAYEKACFEWLNAQYERATGDFNVECVAYHRRGRNGRQVARIELVATDAHGNSSVVQTISGTSLSAFQTQGQIVDAYKATIPVAALTQGDLCTIDAKVYPWIGDASAVLTLSTDGVAWPTANPQTQLHFLNDKAGTYGGAIAYVRASASGGAVSLVDATAKAAPFPTVNAALAAIVTFNNANRGHNDHSGATIFLMDDGAGGAVAHQQTASSAAVAAGNCWTDVRVDAGAVGAVTFTTSATTANRNVADKLRWFVNMTAVSQCVVDSSAANAYEAACFEGITVTYSGGVATPFVRRFGLTYLRNVTLNGITIAGQSPFSGDSTNRAQIALGLGVVCVAAANQTIKPFGLIGCLFGRHSIVENNYTSVPNWDSSDGMVIANNIFNNTQVASLLVDQLNYSRGLAIVQNVFERAVVSSGIQCLSISENGFGCDNLIFLHNTIPGADTGSRLNVLYTDDANSGLLIKRGCFKYNLGYEYNTKSDTFTTTSATTGRNSNWRKRYWSGDSGGNVFINGDSSANANNPDPNGGNWLGEFSPSSNAFKVGAAAVGFTNNQSGTAGAGTGAYTLTGASNSAYNRVVANDNGLGHDLNGVARKGDGSGACGAYERTA